MEGNANSKEMDLLHQHQGAPLKAPSDARKGASQQLILFHAQIPKPMKSLHHFDLTDDFADTHFGTPRDPGPPA